MDGPDAVVPGIVEKYNLTVERIHTHIGSGSDPEIWQQVATRSLSFCKIWDTVNTLNLGAYLLCSMRASFHRSARQLMIRFFKTSQEVATKWDATPGNLQRI